MKLARAPLAFLCQAAAAGLLVLLGACGDGGSGSALRPPAVDELRTAQRVAGFPNDIDYYIPAGATRAIVFLHGGTGRNYALAATLELNLNVTGADPEPPTPDTVDWAWLRSNKVIAVFPQGLVAPGTSSATTWSNHAMNSGQDDVAFLQALAASLRAAFPLSTLALSGHSMGGTMTNRMWCESPSTFDAYVAIAGPASAYYLDPATPCRPAQVQRYLGIIGSDDRVMRDQDWTAERWTILPLLSETPGFIETQVIGEWVQFGERARQRCGETPLLGAASTADNTESWTACGGALGQKRVLGADHGINSIESTRGRRMLDDVAAFVGF